MRRKIITWLCNADLYWEIVIRDSLTCQVCGRKGRIIKGKAVCGKYLNKWVTMEIDHIQSLYYDGNNEKENLRLTCRKCNRSLGK